jgi:methylthioribose-1-phosphate isomerase
VAYSSVTPARWIGDAATGHLELLDQRLLPTEETWLPFHTGLDAARGIKDMVVRGAPAIGLTAAYGVALAVRDAANTPIEKSLEALKNSRPTAVNLFWALDRMAKLRAEVGDDVARLLQEAENVREADVAANVAMGDHGAARMPDNARILTICNTGSLATAGYGTAAGVIRSCHRQGKLKQVYACETRPYLQGARLTMWELMKDEVPVTLITDGMPGHMMQRGMIDAVIAGADRIAANGDSANKIGTYQLAVLAKHHGIPFFIAAPTTTVDLNTADGSGIPIEQRSVEEVVTLKGIAIAPQGSKAEHPAFDVTPAELITGIVTECGVAEAPFQPTLEAYVRSMA